MNNPSPLPLSTEAGFFQRIFGEHALSQSLIALGIHIPTNVQADAIPQILDGHDLIVQAQTGGGKTLAFVLPILLDLLSNPDKRGTHALIIAPTRELAVQIREVFLSITTLVKPACIIGGASINAQLKELRIDSRVVVGTPGRLLDLINQREIILRKCRTFVLDEADEMLSMGFVEEIRDILSRLPKPRQGLFFSATITPRVNSLAQSFLNQPKTLLVANKIEDEGTPLIEHLYCTVDGSLTGKVSALQSLIASEDPRSAIIFCNTKSDTEFVQVFLQRRGCEAKKINSDLSQKERESVMKSFREGELKILIATDVAARGIDIKELDLVVNYAIHDQVETYVHRSGRTGRAGRKGRSISIIGPRDMGAFHALKKHLSIDFQQFELGKLGEPS